MKLKPRLFALLTMGFILATIVGTVSHELGHIAIAKALGYNTRLYYDSMDYNNPESKSLYTYYEAHKDKIRSAAPSPEKEYFNTLNAVLERESFYITLSGPLQTIITGTIGVALLWFRRKKIRQFGLRWADWVYIFLAFFWSRQIFNCAFGLLFCLKNDRATLSGDEIYIDQYLGFPNMVTDSVGALLASVLLIWVVFWIIPKSLRLTFILSGFAGSALGFMIWMYWLGPVVLP